MLDNSPCSLKFGIRMQSLSDKIFKLRVFYRYSKIYLGNVETNAVHSPNEKFTVGTVYYVKKILEV